MTTKSLFPEQMMNKELSIDSIASKLTYFQEQVKLLHWQTSSYAEHKALDKLYNSLIDFKDDIIEKIIGYTNKRPRASKMEQLKDYSPTLSMQIVSDLISFADELEEYADANKMPDICNIAQSLSGESAKIKYLLTLS